MPGPSATERPWGDLPLVVDTSAWARSHLPAVRHAWQQALLAEQLRLSPVARLEFLFAARDGAILEALADELSSWRSVGLTSTIVRGAEAAMRELSHHSAGAHRLPVIDYLIAASAQEIGGAVLHYDRDYDTLAEVMTFRSVWLAPPGTLA